MAIGLIRKKLVNSRCSYMHHTTIWNNTALRQKLMAEGVETHISNIALQFSGEESRISGTVRVATMEALGSLFLAPKFVDLYKKVPSINIELVTASHWINLPKREADVLISFPKPNGHRIDGHLV